MGVPKLMQDLLPYADEIVLGCGTGEASRHAVPVIRKVVIDGPSLVYYVYSRLHPRYDPSMAGVDAQPSYTEISLGVVEFLRVLTSRLIDMFDSHKPKSACWLTSTEKQYILMVLCHRRSNPSVLSAWRELVPSSRTIENSVRGRSSHQA
jgi:hypothetical protein